MMQSTETPLKELVLSNATFGPNEIQQIIEAIASDYAEFTALRDAVDELEMREGRTPADSVRLGVCLYLLGRFRQAQEILASSDGGALALFYTGRIHFAREEYDQAVGSYRAAQAAGYDGDQCSVVISEALRNARRGEEALETLNSLSGPIEQTSDYLYQRGATVAALGGNPSETIALYERAVTINDKHVGALFGLANENDRRGNDDEAMRLYQMSAACFPTHVGSLLNLGLMYEDRADFEKARLCYQRILDAYPSEPRARLYMKDVEASSDMYFDEEAQKRRERMTQILGIPVTDFELSVRSRNCLQKMGIQTLGDLTSTSEQQLLASKNFGETSLVEIREMLSARGLELGQFASEKAAAEPPVDYSEMSADEQAMLERPISDLSLSVRARKCMVRLGLNTIGELLRKTGDDLLECKNFGVTSLNEVREKLTIHGLKLRGD